MSLLKLPPASALKVYQLCGSARLRYFGSIVILSLMALGWPVLLLIAVHASFGHGTIFPLIAVTYLLIMGGRSQVTVVWKIERRLDGLVFCGLFRKTFVPFVNLLGLKNKSWTQESVYIVSCRGGETMKFPAGMEDEDELLSLIRGQAPQRPLVDSGEIKQDKAFLFVQCFSILWAIVATLVGGGEFLFRLLMVLRGDMMSVGWIFHGLIFFNFGIVVGLCTIFRAKQVKVIGRGLRVKTLAAEFNVDWQDIKAIKEVPVAGKTLLIKYGKGWFFLGSEIDRADELMRMVREKATTLPSAPSIDASGKSAIEQDRRK